MAEDRGLGNNRRRGCRDVSPDSVILNFESQFSSLFSSASASVDRCSFASDAVDHDPLSSDISQHLCRPESVSCPDLDLPHSNKNIYASANGNGGCLSQKVEKAKVGGEEDDNKNVENSDEIQALDSARSSFSLALKECQERRCRSEALIKKQERRRPASLDLNNSAINVVSASPRLVVMQKSSRKSFNFPSPGPPNYPKGSVRGVNRGWSSERVPLSNNVNRRHVGAAMLPLSNGRALPSKWEDAERWIFSPITGRHLSYQQQQLLKRPKSKSGPLGSPGLVHHYLYSPAVPMYDSSNSSFHMTGSLFSSGAMPSDGLSFHGVSGANASFSNSLEPCIARSVSLHGCTDLIPQESLQNSQVSRRDMATQMSPEDSCPSSPRKSSFSHASVLPIVEVESRTSSKSEATDVQIDDRVIVTRWSKKYSGQRKGSEDMNEWKSSAVEPHSSTWDVSDTIKSISKARRDEAKITAWENLQKAKAEAAIRKLEIKLEKKRASSMDMIMKKLRSAQKKAQEMRRAVLTNQALHVSKADDNSISVRRTRHMSSLSGCFTCHAF